MMVRRIITFLLLCELYLPIGLVSGQSSTLTKFTTVLSPQCYKYRIIDDETRSVNETGGKLCDAMFFNQNPMWVRFVGKGGTQIPTSRPDHFRCGTARTGWYKGVMPTVPDTTNNGTVCFSWATSTCQSPKNISVTHCGSFYVYQLSAPGFCHARYCTDPTSSMIISEMETSTMPSKRTESNSQRNAVTRNNRLICTSQPESSDYVIYTLSADDGTALGDVMPYFDSDSKETYILYLKDVWNDATNQRHPWYGLRTINFYSYSMIATGELLSSDMQGCSQDFALGTGSIIKKENIYYAFYTGHNSNSPSPCINTKEGIMLAISPSLTQKFMKDPTFSTLYAPIGQGFDEKDNFRDPLVFYDVVSTQYYLIASARTWRGVIIYYTSSDLHIWSYQGLLYDGGSTNFFMMKTPDLFKIGDTYYLLFSDIDSKNVYYRKSLSPTGPWNNPTGEASRFDGNGFYGAKVIADNYGDHYIFAWINRLEGDTDAGTWKWGGNLVVHKLYQMSGTKDLAVTIPHTLKAYLERDNEPVIEHSRWGIVTNPLPDTFSFSLVSVLNADVTNVIFDPINLTRYKISAIVSFTRSMKDFGFMIGACDGYNHFYSLRFVPSQHRFSFDKSNHSALTSSSIATTDVPFTLLSNTDYQVEIVIENSVLVVYLDNRAALTTRIYWASKTSWGIFVDNASATFKNVSVTKP